MHLLIAELGDGLLDQAAIDRCKSALYGTIRREADRALDDRERDARQLTFNGATE